MNTLTQIKPRNPELLNILSSYQKPEPKTPKYRYPTGQEEFNALDAIFNQEFSRQMTAHEKHSCKMLAKIFTLGVAHHDVYEMACDRVKISEEQLCKFLVGWKNYPEELKNRWRKGAKKYLKVRAEESRSMKEFYARQAYHLNQFDEETAEKVLDLEDTEIDVQLSTEIALYLQPDPNQEHTMTCKQIAQYLALQSKGVIYLTPVEVEKELRSRKFTKSENGFYIKIK